MAIRCACCGREFDVTAFEFGHSVLCECGARVRGDLAHVADLTHVAYDRDHDDVRERRLALQRATDRVCQLILSDAAPAIDPILAALAVRRLARELFPGEQEWFDLLYGSRFRRLWQQFRGVPVPPTL